jgi:dTDP-4-dehydrorhamnose reductase
VIDLDLEGIVHLTNAGDATWFELASEALKQAGIECPVEPLTSDAYPTAAKRPEYSVLGSSVMDGLEFDALPAWQEGLADHLARKGLLKGRESK